MKTFYLLLLVGICNSASAQYRFYGGYSGSAPRGKMAENIKMLHSFNIGGNTVIPGTCERILAGLDISIGTYAIVIFISKIRLMRAHARHWINGIF